MPAQTQTLRSNRKTKTDTTDIMKNTPIAYTELKPLVLQVLTHYKKDFFVHDRRMMRNFPRTNFLHFTRATGTQLILLHQFDSESFPAEGEKIPYLFGHADRHHILNQIPECVKYLALNTVSTCRFYFAGTKDCFRSIVELSPQEAINHAERYVSMIRNAWKQ
jgi:hypothetical protein